VRPLIFFPEKKNPNLLSFPYEGKAQIETPSRKKVRNK